MWDVIESGYKCIVWINRELKQRIKLVKSNKTDLWTVIMYYDVDKDLDVLFTHEDRHPAMEYVKEWIED